MSSRTIRTLVLALILAALVVPSAGPMTVPGLLIIAALVVLDLGLERRRQARREVAPRP